ncbi:MAG TPA: hypothetical protein VG324_29220, partial [Blastocatellia bacterium]|nr:hypothetical protein [Blastocatellia bacterium]
TSICKMGRYIALVLFGVLFSMFLTWSGYPRDAWLEGDWVTSGILGGIMVSLFIVCNILYQILFTEARSRRLTGYSSGWASMIISIGLAGMGIGWLIATKIQWPQLTAERNIPLTNIFGTLVGLIIGLSIGLGTHKAFTRVS